MVRVLCLVALTVVFIPACLVAQASLVSVSPSVSYLRLSRVFHIDPGFTYGAGVDLSVSRSFDVWLSFSTARMSAEYDQPEGSAVQNVGFFCLGGGLRYLLTNREAPAALSVALGAGVVRFSADEHTVPIGGLGTRIVAARTDARAVLVSSVGVAFRVGPMVALRVEPGALLVSPFDAPQGSIQVTGGIRVALL
jgi:hypothetical protein